MQLSLEVTLDLQHLQARVKEVSQPQKLLWSNLLHGRLAPLSDPDTGLTKGLCLSELFPKEK